MMTGRVSNGDREVFAKRAIELMGQFGISPTPSNYAVWTAYTANSIPELCNLIDERVRSGESVDDTFSEKLSDRFFSVGRTQDAFLDLGGRLNREVAAASKSIEAAALDAGIYEQTLSEAGDALSGPLDPATFEEIVVALTTATNRLQARSRNLETRIDETVCEIGSLQDELAAAHEEGMTDPLTGLANRKRFDLAIKKAKQSADRNQTRVSLILCDIDHFKQFNDTWGHQTGDQIIRFVADILMTHAEPETTVARYGGEEFAIVMPGASLNDAFAVAEMVRSAISGKKFKRRSTNEDLGHVTVSAGVSAYRKGEAVRDLIERCDTNLYRSKTNGRNRITADDPPRFERPIRNKSAA